MWRLGYLQVAVANPDKGLAGGPLPDANAAGGACMVRRSERFEPARAGLTNQRAQNHSPKEQCTICFYFGVRHIADPRDGSRIDGACPHRSVQISVCVCRAHVYVSVALIAIGTPSKQQTYPRDEGMALCDMSSDQRSRPWLFRLV